MGLSSSLLYCWTAFRGLGSRIACRSEDDLSAKLWLLLDPGKHWRL